MKITETVKDNKTTTEYKLSSSEYALIFGVLGCIKYIIKQYTNNRRNK